MEVACPVPTRARPVPNFLRRALPVSARCPIFLDGHARICPVPTFSARFQHYPQALWLIFNRKLGALK